MERSIIVNKPLDEVQRIFQEKLTAYGIKATGTDQEFSGEFGHQYWLIQIEAEKTGRRSFLRGSIPNPDSPSAIRKIFSKLKLVPLQAPDALDLRKLKALIETGEIPTIKGQPTGERSNLGRLLERGQTALPQKVPIESKTKAKTRKTKAAKPQAKTRAARKESQA